MIACHDDDFENSRDVQPVRVSSYAGQHAVEAWENEGGGSSDALVRELPRTLAEPGSQARHRTGWVTYGPPRDAPKEAPDEEDQILRSLGAAVIMRWATIPTKLQKELLEDASSIGDLLQADALKGQIASILHDHRDDRA
jgi:hypothetical protein